MKFFCIPSLVFVPLEYTAHNWNLLTKFSLANWLGQFVFLSSTLQKNSLALKDECLYWPGQAKGQIKSEWIYEVIDFLNYQLKNLKDFCPESFEVEYLEISDELTIFFFAYLN